VLKLAGQRGAEACLPDVVDAAHDVERLIEGAHDFITSHCESGAELGGGQGNAGDALGVVGPGRDVRGVAKQLAGVDSAARPCAGIGLGNQDVDELRVVEVDGGLGDGRSQASEVVGGLGKGERLAVVLRRDTSPLRGAVGSVYGDRCDEVTGELG